MDSIQGKLFVTVIQAQNLVVKQEKTLNAAQEIVGTLFDPFAQSLEKIQNFSDKHVKKLGVIAPIFTVPGVIVGGVGVVVGGVVGNVAQGVGGVINAISKLAEKDNSSNGSGNDSDSSGKPEKMEPGIVTNIVMDDQEFKTQRSSELEEPKWNQSYSFNITNPMALLKFTVSLSSDEKEFVIGTSTMNLIEEPHLWEQKPVAKWINLTKKINKESNNRNSSSYGNDDESGFNSDSNSNNNSSSNNNGEEEEIVGRVELQLQYKYRKVWDSIYCGKMLLLESKYEEAIEQFNEAITKYPTNPKLYSLVVDCYLGLKQYAKAFENSIKFLQYDQEYHGYLKAANVLMESGQLDKAQNFIDKARQRDQTDSEDIKFAQMQLDHLMLVATVNNLLEQGYEDFKNQEYSSAIQSFTSAIESNSHSPIFYELRSLCYVAAKNYQQAIADTNRILDIDHNWPKKDTTVSGYLWKDGQINVLAKKRWFTMKSLFMFYYVDQNDLNPQGMICLNEFGVAPKPGQKVKFQVKTKDRDYYLKVDSSQPAEFDKWVDALTKLSKLRVRLPPIKESQDKIIWKNATMFMKKKEKTSFMLPDVMMLPEQLFVESGKFAFSIGDKIKSKLTNINLSECTMKGWVYKMGQLNKDWQRRYFMISGSNLYYAKIKDFDEKTTTSITPTGTLPLEKAKIDPSPTSTNKSNSFEVISLMRRKMLLATDSQEDKDIWMKAIVIASGVQLASLQEKDTDVVTPTSEELFKSRGRKIKSLRAVPNLEQQLKDQKVKEQEKKEVQEQQNRKISTKDVSSIESKYFTKFNLPVNPIGGTAIISSKSSTTSNPPSLNGSSNTTPNTSSPNLSSSNGSTPNSPNLSSSTNGTLNNRPKSSRLSTPPTTTALDNDDDDSKESTGLLSGKNKSINGDVESGSSGNNDDKKRCCKCIVQ